MPTVSMLVLLNSRQAALLLFSNENRTIFILRARHSINFNFNFNDGGLLTKSKFRHRDISSRFTDFNKMQQSDTYIGSLHFTENINLSLLQKSFKQQQAEQVTCNQRII